MPAAPYRVGDFAGADFVAPVHELLEVRREDVHEVFLLRVLQVEVDAVADYQRHEPFVRAEQLLGAVAPLVYAERLGGSHLLRDDYDEVATHGKFARHGILAFLRVEDRAPVVHDVEEPVAPCAELGLGVFLALKEPRRRLQRLFQRALLAVRARCCRTRGSTSRGRPRRRAFS